MNQYQAFDLPFVSGQDQSGDDKVMPSGALTKVENSLFEKSGRLKLRPGMMNLPEPPGEFGAHSIYTSLPGGSALIVGDGYSRPVNWIEQSGVVKGSFGTGRASLLEHIASLKVSDERSFKPHPEDMIAGVDFTDDYIVVCSVIKGLSAGHPNATIGVKVIARDSMVVISSQEIAAGSVSIQCVQPFFTNSGASYAVVYAAAQWTVSSGLAQSFVAYSWCSTPTGKLNNHTGISPTWFVSGDKYYASITRVADTDAFLVARKIIDIPDRYGKIQMFSLAPSPTVKKTFDLPFQTMTGLIGYSDCGISIASPKTESSSWVVLYGSRGDITRPNVFVIDPGPLTEKSSFISDIGDGWVYSSPNLVANYLLTKGIPGPGALNRLGELYTINTNAITTLAGTLPPGDICGAPFSAIGAFPFYPCVGASMTNSVDGLGVGIGITEPKGTLHAVVSGNGGITNVDPAYEPHGKPWAARHGDEVAVVCQANGSAIVSLYRIASPHSCSHTAHSGVSVVSLPFQIAEYSGEVRDAGFLCYPSYRYVPGSGGGFQFFSLSAIRRFGGLTWVAPAAPPLKSPAGASGANFAVYSAPGYGDHIPVGYLSAVDGTILREGITNSIIYTQGGTLSNEAPPACDSIVHSSGRLWAGALHQDPYRVQVSKALEPEKGVEWSYFDSFFVSLPEPVKALGAMDSAVVSFCDESAFVINFDGPDDRGIIEGSSGVGQRIPLSSPCISKHTVTTEDGIFFVSKRGIEIMPRGFSSPNFTGQNVADITNSFDKCCGIVVMPHDSTVRFLFSSADSCVVAVMNQKVGAWTILRYGFGATSIQAIGSRMVLFGSSISSSYVEDEGRVSDSVSGSASIIQTWETAWLRFGGLNGSCYARKLNLLGTWVGNRESGLTDCKVTLSFAFDDQKSWSTLKKTWTLSSADYSEGDDVCLELMIPIQKVKSIRFRVEVEGDLLGHGITVFYDGEGEGPRLASRSKG